MHRMRRLVFSSFGVPISLSYPRAIERSVRTLLPPARKQAATDVEPKRYDVQLRGERFFSVTHDGGDFVAEGEDLALVLDMLDRYIRQHIASEAPEHVFVHAGAVAVEGVAIVLPGLSFAGKSTLVGALVRGGATYLSDEYAVLCVDGRVVAYPRTISVRVDGVGPATEVDPATIGSVSDGRPVPVGLVALTEYQPGAKWSPHRLGTGLGALRMFENCVTAASRPEQSLHVIRKAVERAVILEGPRGEADELAPELIAAARAAAAAA